MPKIVQGPDVKKIREQMYSLVSLDHASSILDLGCGYGNDLFSLGQRCGPDARLTGIDSAFKPIERAREKTSSDPRFAFIHKDIESGLPFEDESFDVVWSCNLLECIKDKDALLSEVSRVLKPDGQVVFSHIDWDTQVINGTDKQLIRKIVAAFSDWTQGWMSVSDGWMGRRMTGLFRNHEDFSGEVIPLVLVNENYTPGLYGYDRIKDFETMAEEGLISEEDLASFQKDLEKTVSEGNFFYSVTMYVFNGKKDQPD